MTLRSKDFFESYLKAPLPEDEKIELRQNEENYIKNGSFEGELAFGTGGMRSIAAHGTNRINIYNITRLNIALAKILREKFNDKISIMIAYDSRNSSEMFSKVTYHFFKNIGMDVSIFSRPTPTPVLSYGVFKNNCHCGIVITASHNPPQYNGYKVYWQDGGQIVGPIDKEIESEYKKTPYTEIPDDLPTWSKENVDKNDFVDDEVISNYITDLKKEPFIGQDEKNIKILYSPLYGSGGWAFEKVFSEFGFNNFQILSKQKNPDGNFPNLKSPNPEEKEAFDELIIEAGKNDYDILLATDPDADRVGCAYRISNEYVFLTGNEIGSLMLEYLCRKKAKSLKSPYICKTIVTTNLQNKIAQSYDIKVFETLTGFKYIASELVKDPDNYLFGGEESFGYLPINWVRDKDSISSAIAISSLAEEYDIRTLLDEIALKHGIYHEVLHNITFSAENTSAMSDFLEKLKEPEKLIKSKICERDVIDILDLREDGKAPKTTEIQYLKNNLPSSLVIQYFFIPEGKLTIRPSGTEPKVKIYISLYKEPPQNKDLLETERKKLKLEAENILTEFLNRLNM
ncbi:MAG: phospho-sugar mutase [Spirochaetia bacterium]|nr:phospho-sugar mutase [Spirochaetia bacterium]